MSLLGWHPRHLVDNTDTLFLGDQHWQQAVLVFLYFYFSVFLSLPKCQSVCVSVRLFAIHLKFLTTCCNEVPVTFESNSDKNLFLSLFDSKAIFILISLVSLVEISISCVSEEATENIYLLSFVALVLNYVESYLFIIQIIFSCTLVYLKKGLHQESMKYLE